MTRNSFELNEQTLSVIEEIGGHMPGGFFIYQAEEPETLNIKPAPTPGKNQTKK